MMGQAPIARATQQELGVRLSSVESQLDVLGTPAAVAVRLSAMGMKCCEQHDSKHAAAGVSSNA